MSDTKLRKDQDKKDKKKLKKIVKKVIEQKKDDKEWKNKNGIKNEDIKNQKISKKPEFCETRIEHVCWNVYPDSIVPKEYCKTRNCKKCKEALMKAKKCAYGNKKKLVEYPPLRF